MSQPLSPDTGLYNRRLGLYFYYLRVIVLLSQMLLFLKLCRFLTILCSKILLDGIYWSFPPAIQDIEYTFNKKYLHASQNASSSRLQNIYYSTVMHIHIFCTACKYLLITSNSYYCLLNLLSWRLQCSQIVRKSDMSVYNTTHTIFTHNLWIQL